MGVITDINKPLVVQTQPPPSPNVNGLALQEKKLLPGDITAIQQALCIAPTGDLGTAQPPSDTRNALASFFNTYGNFNGNPLLIDSDKKLSVLLRVETFVQGKGGCSTTTFNTAQAVASAFKKGK